MDNPNKTVIAVDFDGTLAEYHGFKGADQLGEPIPDMVERVKQAIALGAEVYIFTARVNPSDSSYQQSLDATQSYMLIAEWCIRNIGQLLPITHEKSRSFTEMWDDRSKQVLPNTGVFLEDLFTAEGVNSATV